MKSIVQRFGEQNELLGFVNLPATPSDTAIVFLNAGLLPSMGPFRMFLELAEKCCQQGYATLRFDQSGKGDSHGRNASRPDANFQDFKAVEQLLNGHGIHRFILLGLCSGADDASQIAESFESVHGIVMLDGWASKNWSHSWRYYGSRLVRVTPLINAVSRRLGNGPGADALVPLSLRNWPDDQEMTQRYRTLLDRGVSLLSVFTGGVEKYYNHKGQLAEAVGTHQGLQEVFMPHAEHIFPDPAHRQELENNVCQWLVTRAGENVVES